MSLTEQIHPALIDSCTEFFDAKSFTYNLCNGMTEKSDFLSHKFTALLAEAIEADKDAKRSLTKMGINDPQARIRKFYQCNYSAFDKHPDITKDGQLGPREYVPCSLREGGCSFENKLCRNPQNLTNREMQVAKRIARGNYDMEICSELSISENTLRNHKNNIEEKIERKGKSAIANWIGENNLL